MKVAILAGGRGSRLLEETQTRPKPMVEIGTRPILWHIMMHYSMYGFNDFIIALGYKGEIIKKYFVDYHSLETDLTINTRSGILKKHDSLHPDWNLELINTGLKTNTGGRIKRLAPYLGNETFMLTWGDGLSDIDLKRLLEFHKAHGKLITVTAVRPPARFGHLELDGDAVVEFSEKPQTAEGWINGAFFVVEPKAIDYIENDSSSWEHGALKQLAEEGQLMAYQHEGFWQCMDTFRDRVLLQNMWESGNAPWAKWKNPASEY